jgi:hypothetical protein
MPVIPETYAPPGLRWGLFLHDHPNAPDPVFRVARYDDPEVNVPEDWAKGGEEHFTGEFVVCTIDPGNGSPTITAWREIPGREKRSGSWVAVSKTPENWRKLTTMALGRALKQAGYPDDTDDLKTLLLWRRRDVELKMLASGHSPPPALGPPPSEADLDAAARHGTAEHRETPGHDDHPDAGGDEIVVGPDDQWRPETEAVLRPIVDQLSEADRLALQEFADSKRLGPYVALTGGPLRLVKARAVAMLPKRAPGADGPPGPPAEPVSSPPGPPTAGSGPSAPSPAPSDPNATAQRAKVLALYRAVHGISDDRDDLLESIFEVAPHLEDLTEDTSMTYGEIAEAWEVLRNHGVEG